MITDVPGVLVGHWTDLDGLTGCTVVLLPPGATGACAVVGAAPASRETRLLGPSRLVSEVQAFVIGGGSSYGLSAVDGVMALLEERGVGFTFGDAVVPLVPAACLYDLGIGSSRARPGAAAGRAAAEAANLSFDEGSVGAGTGATVGKWAGMEFAMKGGIGSASARFTGGSVGERSEPPIHGGGRDPVDSGRPPEQTDVVVGAIVACNAVGDVIDERGQTLAGARTEGPPVWQLPPSTVLGVVATNARLDKATATHVARMAAVGISRAVRPAHTFHDGDTVFLAATNETDADPTLVGSVGAEVVAEALRRGVRAARGLGGVPGCGATWQS